MNEYQIIEQIRNTGKRVFYNPLPQLDYEYLATNSLANNTYRGFHKIDKDGPGAKEAFESVLIKNQQVIVQSINKIKTEKDLDLFAGELCRVIKSKLTKYIRNDQLESFNKIRKPLDIVLEHMIAMGSDFVSARAKITKFLFLPLDSQMFQSSFVFSDKEVRELRISRNFTFKDIYDESHYTEIQVFLKEKAEKLGIDRIFFDLVWNERYKSKGGNLFETNPQNPTARNSETILNTIHQMKEEPKKMKTKVVDDDLTYTEKQWKRYRENHVREKLQSLREELIKDSTLKKLSISPIDESFIQDPTIWVEGFMKGIRLQVKMQLAGDKVVLNLRPSVYNVESREKFSRLMAKCGYLVKVPAGSTYAPIADFVTKFGYTGGIDAESVEEITTVTKGAINKIISV